MDSQKNNPNGLSLRLLVGMDVGEPIIPIMRIIIVIFK